MIFSRSARLESLLEEHGIVLDAQQTKQLYHYSQLLWDWNRHINLTRHTTYEKFVGRDVIDSFQLTRFIDISHRVLDIGTGGGVPGLIIAIARPDLQVTVCESIQKKAQVVSAIVEALELSVTVQHARAERLLTRMTFDTLVARAVAPLAKLLHWLPRHPNFFQQLLLIKSRRWIEEETDAQHQGLLNRLELRKMATYIMPETGAESFVLRVTPAVPRRRT